MDLPLQAEGRPTYSAGSGKISAKNQLRRIAAVVERSHRRDEPGRAASTSPLSPECLQSALSRPAPACQTGPYGPVASFRSRGQRPSGAGDPGYLLHSQLVTVAGSV